MNRRRLHKMALLLVSFCIVLQPSPTPAQLVLDPPCARWPATDAIWMAKSGHPTQIDCHADTMLVPASALKITTALLALDTLGPEFRFPTEVHRTPENDLVIKGYGDPILVSESLSELARQLAEALGNSAPVFRHLIVDGSYFVTEMLIPGVHQSRQPYDSPIGAVCVNFNTILFSRKKGQIVSAEPQTPLVPYARDRIRKLKLPAGRLLLNQTANDASLYAGHLLVHFLQNEGIQFDGSVQVKQAMPVNSQRVIRYESPDTLADIIRRMMRFSNNFIANQLYFAAGAARFGAPATLNKSQQLGREYLSQIPGTSTMTMVEGSGLSRGNRMTARQLGTLLRRFSKWRHLLRFDGGDTGHGYKTGTLSGIQTRVGFMTGETGDEYHYAILLNSGRQSMADVLGWMRGQIGASSPHR